MSNNGPVLQQIVGQLNQITVKLNEMDLKINNMDVKINDMDVKINDMDVKINDMDKRFGKNITSLKDQMKDINAYIKKESDIQEAKDVQQFIKAYELVYMAPTEILNIDKFYRPDDKYLTDIDGCVLVRPADEAYIIESKHVLRLVEVRTKLQQFCEIIDIIDGIRKHTFQRIEGTSFNAMARLLTDFPTNIHFIFSSDSMDESMRKYILDVNDGTIKRDDHNAINMFKTSILYSSIQTSPDVKDWAKDELERLIKLKSMKKILDVINIPKSGLEPFKDEIVAQLEMVDPCYTKLVGRLGLLHLGKLITSNIKNNIIGYPQQTIGGKRHNKLKRVTRKATKGEH